MSYDSFKEKYPDYKIIPEKKSRWIWPLTWLAAIGLVVLVPAAVIYKLSTLHVPTPLVAGSNKYTLGTLEQIARTQTDRGEYADAAQNFARYFALGGQDADVMATYAYALSEIGRKDLARAWSQKAIHTNPKSKAARLIYDSLETK